MHTYTWRDRDVCHKLVKSLKIMKKITNGAKRGPFARKQCKGVLFFLITQELRRKVSIDNVGMQNMM